MADVTEFDEHVEVILSFPMLDTKSKKNKKDIVKKVGFGSTHFKEPEKTKNTKKEKEYQLPVRLFFLGSFFFRWAPLSSKNRRSYQETVFCIV